MSLGGEVDVHGSEHGKHGERGGFGVDKMPLGLGDTSLGHGGKGSEHSAHGDADVSLGGGEADVHEGDHGKHSERGGFGLGKISLDLGDMDAAGRRGGHLSASEQTEKPSRLTVPSNIDWQGERCTGSSDATAAANSTKFCGWSMTDKARTVEIVQVGIEELDHGHVLSFDESTKAQELLQSVIAFELCSVFSWFCKTDMVGELVDMDDEGLSDNEVDDFIESADGQIYYINEGDSSDEDDDDDGEEGRHHRDGTNDTRSIAASVYFSELNSIGFVRVDDDGCPSVQLFRSKKGGIR
jgi:hypothetical protein